MSDFGKILISVGAFLVVVGAVVMVLARLHVPIGRLPGDIAWRSRSGNTQVYFPIVTCIVLSVVLSLLMWIVQHFRR